jgi:prevent-host-death family protein
MTSMGTRKSRTVQYNIADAKARLSSVVREARAGYDVIIAKDGTPLVKVVSVTAGARTPGSAKGLITMAPDFDAPLDDFSPYR